jgi:isoleucyl-tRNA synthetase
MDREYMESVLWAFKQLYDKGLVYESMRVMPYSWACETPLSNFETRLDNAYREKKSKAATVSFKLQKAPEGVSAQECRVMAWTTTPWTLPSNLALAVSEDITYACVEKDGVCYILSQSAVSKYAKELAVEEGQDVPTISGKDLVGLSYQPLFPYFEEEKNAFVILAADFVEDGDGTGIVHLAPGFGEDDQRVCDEHGIAVVCPVDSAGKFTNEAYELDGLSLEGKQVFDANDDVIIYLKQQGAWHKTEQYIHNYPHCWRTDTPLIYKALPSWYVKVTEFKDRMVELNQQINWIPSHIKDGQFGKWLENARDWSISRNRFWGTPIPIWKSDNPRNKNLYVFGSIAELEEFFGVEVKDLHRPFIDSLTKPDPEDSNYTLRRVEDVFDCWFESGSMPYAQSHYPFENKEWFEEHFPADFIVEYVAQTRGWFYTLMVLSTALFDRPPFKNCICHGVVLDDKGQKLSKRLNNYADPMDVFSKYGSDAMRWVMVSAPIMHGGELLIDKEGNMIRDAVRLVLKPVWNAYHFFTLYANADGVKASYQLQPQTGHVMDRYILSKVSEAVAQIEAHMDAYNTPAACKEVEQCFEVLNNWYIRRNKERFWREEKDADKQAAYDTLYTALHVLVRAVSPLLPLISEEIWQGLVGADSSVHLDDYPEVYQVQGTEGLVAAMDRVRDICNAGLSVRNAENIRVRQPLQSLTIVGDDEGRLRDYESIIQEELNVKEVRYESQVESFADYNLKINFPVLGKRLPAKIKDIIAASKQGKWSLAEDGSVEVAGEVLSAQECELQLFPKDAKAAQPLSSNDALIILDLNPSDVLLQEGIARDVVRLIQQSRKEADLHISSRIKLHLTSANDNVNGAINAFKDYIMAQTLAESLENSQASGCAYTFEHAIDGETIELGFDVAV